MDCVSDMGFCSILIDLCLIYICLATENLFFCLTPFSETYELRGYISMEIDRMEWTAYVACQDAVMKASVAKQSLVDDDQSKVYVA